MHGPTQAVKISQVVYCLRTNLYSKLIRILTLPYERYDVSICRKIQRPCLGIEKLHYTTFTAVD
jgi:hypothetical protein